MRARSPGCICGSIAARIAGGYSPRHCASGKALFQYVQTRRRVGVGLARAGRPARLKIVNAPDRGARDFFAEHVHGRAVREIDVVYRPVEIVFAAAVPLAQRTAEQIEDRWLVDGRKTLDAVPETRGDQRRVVGKPCHRFPVLPSAAIFQRLRQIPVIQAQPRFDAGGQQFVDQPVVEGEAGFVDQLLAPAATRAARRPRIDRPERPAASSARHPPGSDGSGRTRHRRCRGSLLRRFDSRRPRCSVRGRLPWSRPRSGSSKSRRPR